MYFMNEMDIEFANEVLYRHARHLTNTREAVDNLQWLMHWTNHNSDGWAYWPKPVLAAKKLMMLVEAATNSRGLGLEQVDLDRDTLDAAYRPIKSFLTRQGVCPGDRPLDLR